MKINKLNFKNSIILIVFFTIALNHLIILTVNNSILWNTLELNKINPVLENLKNLITIKAEDRILKYYPFFNEGLKKKDRYNSYFFNLKTYLYEEFPPFLIPYINCTDLDGNIATITFAELYPNQKPHLEIYFDQYYDFFEHLIPTFSDPLIPRVLHALEPPFSRFCSVREDCIKYFNWSIGYEEGSDIRVNHGNDDIFALYPIEINQQFMLNKNQFIEKRKFEINNNLFNDSVLYAHYKRYEDEESNQINTIILKKYPEYDETPLASWFCSKCDRDTTNNRYEVVKEMMRYIRIDSYGECLKNMPIVKKYNRTNEHAMDVKLEAISNYKFYLSFENSNCLDYLSEKSLHAINSGSVPVVLGHPQILKYLPSGSFIYTGDFKNVKELVDYLKYLNSNDKEYLKYFEWRNNHEIIAKFRQMNGYPTRSNASNWMCPLFQIYQKWGRGLINNKSLKTINLNNICINDTISIK